MSWWEPFRPGECLMGASAFGQRVQSVRRFNRFYTKQIGVLQEWLYRSAFSLTEVPVLYELAHRNQATATELCRELGLDPGYLSRILGSFEKRGFLERTSSHEDARQSLLSLTQQGRKVFAPLEKGSNQETARCWARCLSPHRKTCWRRWGPSRRSWGTVRNATARSPTSWDRTSPATWAG